jgi:hypothetical protein
MVRNLRLLKDGKRHLIPVNTIAASKKASIDCRKAPSPSGGAISARTLSFAFPNEQWWDSLCSYAKQEEHPCMMCRQEIKQKTQNKKQDKADHGVSICIVHPDDNARHDGRLFCTAQVNRRMHGLPADQERHRHLPANDRQRCSESPRHATSHPSPQVTSHVLPARGIGQRNGIYRLNLEKEDDQVVRWSSAKRELTAQMKQSVT